MASSRPTINTLIKAISEPSCRTLGDVTRLLTPNNSADKISFTSSGDPQNQRRLFEKIMDFPAPETEQDFNNLMTAIIESGLTSNLETAEFVFAKRAIEKKNHEWISACSLYGMEGLWSALPSSEKLLEQYLQSPDVSRQVRWRFGQQALKIIRGKNDFIPWTIRAMVILETLLKIEDGEGFPASKTDVKNIHTTLEHRLKNQSFPLLGSWCKRERLHDARERVGTIEAKPSFKF